MPAYKCKIALSSGATIDKIIHSRSASSLTKIVEEEGGFLVHADKLLIKHQKIRPKDFYSFNQEFLTLLKAGLPVVIAFDTIIEKQDGRTYFSRVLQDIRDDISQGTSIPDAFQKYAGVFSPVYVAGLRSGEASGNIPGAIEEFLEHFERSRQIRQKIRSAMVYPAILTICSTCVVIFLIIFVVPSITGSFLEAGARLPFFTRMLLDLSSVVKSNIIGIICFLILAGWIFSYFLKTERGRFVFDRFYIKLPFFGSLSVIYYTALFASSLSTVLKGGMPLNRALTISKELIGNLFFRKKLEKSIKAVEQGKGFAAALKGIGLFPDMALRMVAAGEEGGSLEKVLKDVAQFYEKDVEARLSMVTSTIEPLLMVIMGFVIGFIMLAMYMPIFQMAGTIG